MTRILDLAGSIAPIWADTILHVSWQAAVLVVIALLVVRLGRRWPSPLRYGLLLVALAKFAVPPTLTLAGGVFTSFGPSVASEAAIALDAGEVTLAHPDTTPAVDVPGSTDPTDPIATTTPPARAETAVQPGWLAWLALLHVAGSLACLAHAAWSATRIGRIVRRSAPAEEPELVAAFDEACRHIGLRRAPRLIVSRDVAGPFACGLLRRCVVLPESLSDQRRSALAPILAHELAHHRRRDLWVNWCQVLLGAAWWFNPALWILNRRIREVREECCDDAVLRHRVTSDERYCEILLQAATRHSLSAPAAAFGESRLLARRFRRIMDDSLPRASRLSVPGAIAVIVAAVALLPGLSETSAAAAGTTADPPPRTATPSTPASKVDTILALLDRELAALRAEVARLERLLARLPEDDELRRQAKAVERQFGIVEARRDALHRRMVNPEETEERR